DLVARTRVAGLVLVVEPVDERVLVDEPLADEAIRALDRQRTVAPRAVREHDQVEVPGLEQLTEREVAADRGARHEVHAGALQLRVDEVVLLPAQRGVPERQAVLDLPVGTIVLLEDDAQGALRGELVRRFGARGRATDDGDVTAVWCGRS